MIELQNVSLDYPLDPTDGGSLKADVFNLIKRTKRTRPYFRALSDINLNIGNGERVGIIGLNGAGKSTLLRVISGIFHPTIGCSNIYGTVSPLLDLATGLELHHTGLENIRIRLMFLGQSEDSIDKLTSEIIEFTELGHFINQPARTYSSGMFMRLAFAISTAIKPQILVADEIIGAGDVQFAAKAKLRLERFLDGDHTTVLSSHSFDLIRKFCTRTIWLDRGKIIDDDTTDLVLNRYESNAPFLHR